MSTPIGSGLGDRSGTEMPDAVSHRLENAITELRDLQNLLLAGEGLDPRILADFRDALSRVRNTAWSAQQYLVSQANEGDSTNLFSILAGERVRAAHQLFQAIEADLLSEDVRFQARQLVQLHLAAKALTEQLGIVVGRLG